MKRWIASLAMVGLTVCAVLTGSPRSAVGQQQTTTFSIEFWGTDGRAVSTATVLGSSPLIRRLDQEIPRLGRWRGGEDVGAAARLQGNRVDVSFDGPADSLPLGFWAPSDPASQEERIYVFAGTASAAPLRAVVSPGTIRGQILRPDGRAMPEVTVALVPLDAEKRAASTSYGESWAVTRTDLMGRFSFSRLFPGRYQVIVGVEYLFQREGGSLAGQFPRMRAQPSDPGFLVRALPKLPVEFATGDLALAPFVLEPCPGRILVEVDANRQVTEIDLAREMEAPFWFPRPEKGGVEWTRYDVLKLRQDPAGGIAEFRGIPAGSYQLHVLRDKRWAASYPLDVAASGPDPQHVILPPLPTASPTAIDGRVEDWDRLPLRERTINRIGPPTTSAPEWRIEFFVTAIPAHGTEEPINMANVPVNADGTFHIDGLAPGEYRLSGRYKPYLEGNPAGRKETVLAVERIRMFAELQSLTFPETRVSLPRGEVARVAVRFR
jgi:hypothetical protein